MARTYRLTPGTRIVDWVFSRMTQAGLGASYLTPAGQP
jgi:hypothetical protein